MAPGTRENGLLALLLAASAGCFGGPGGTTGTTSSHGTPSPSLERVISVVATDHDGLPIEGATVVSSLGPSILDQQMTIADGSSTVRAVDGGLVTVHFTPRDRPVYSESTIVLPTDDVIELRLLYVFTSAASWPDFASSITVQGAVGSGRVAYGFDRGPCSSALSGNGSVQLDVSIPFCGPQYDDAYSVWAYTDDAAGNHAYGFVHDIPYSTTIVTLNLAPVTATTETVSATVPSNAVSSFFSLEPFWRGMPIGPPASSNSGGTFDLIGIEGADSVGKIVSFSHSLQDFSQDYVRAPASAVSWSEGAANQAPEILAAALFSTAGTVGVRWTADVQGSADCAYVLLNWNDADFGHVWLFDLPAESGEQSLSIPPLPTGYGAVASSATTLGFVEYRDFDYINAFDQTRAPNREQYFEVRQSVRFVNLDSFGPVFNVPLP